MTSCHLIYTLIFFYVFQYTHQTDLNVGTVLFTKMDLHKPCWSGEDLALLSSRMIFEDLLPFTNEIHIEDDEFIEDIVCYLHEIIDLIRSSTEGRNKRITLLAFTDFLGGYLHHLLYPNAKYAYYAGIIAFGSVYKIKQLFDELKWFLRTNGEGWTKETDKVYCSEVPTLSLAIQKGINTSNTCERIIYYDSMALKKRQVSCPENIEMYLPLPFFDSRTNPSAIAIPYSHYSLRNIETKHSANLILKYYQTAMKCLIEKEANKATVEQFQNNFYTWIVYEVVPKLHDEKFYAAFGGVLRVQDSLASLGAKKVELSTDIPETADDATDAVDISANSKSTSRRKSRVILFMVIGILLWFLFAIIFICCKIRKASRGKDQMSTTSGSTSCKRSGASVCACSSNTKSNRFAFLPSRSTICKSVGTGTEKSNSQTSAPKKHCCCSQCPAVIDPAQSMKVLPSVAEVSEKDDGERKRHSSSRRISFDESSKTSKETARKACIQSLSAFTSKSKKNESSKSSGKSTQDVECWCPYGNESSYSGTTASDYSSTHHNSIVYQASLTSNPLSNKGNLFGYDFHTTTSESSPDDELDFDINTTSTSK